MGRKAVGGRGQVTQRTFGSGQGHDTAGAGTARGCWLYEEDSRGAVWRTHLSYVSQILAAPQPPHPILQLLLVGRASVLPTLYSVQALLINHTLH